MRKITQIITSALVILMLVGIAVGYSYTNTGFKAPWFATDDGYFNSSTVVTNATINPHHMNANNITSGILSNINISVVNDSILTRNSYWDYSDSNYFTIRKNTTKANDAKANSLMYVQSELRNSSFGGLANIVTRIVNTNNGTGAAVGIASSAQTNGYNYSNSGAWGGWFSAGQTGNGYTIGIEINTNSETNRTVIGNASVYGLQISTLGTKLNTAGIMISSSESTSRYKNGIYIQDATEGIVLSPNGGITSGIGLNATNSTIIGKTIVLNNGGLIAIYNNDNSALWSILTDPSDGSMGIYNSTSVLKATLLPSGVLRLPAYTGTGIDYACFDSNGNLVRSDAVC